MHMAVAWDLVPQLALCATTGQALICICQVLAVEVGRPNSMMLMSSNSSPTLCRCPEGTEGCAPPSAQLSPSLNSPAVAQFEQPMTCVIKPDGILYVINLCNLCSAECITVGGHVRQGVLAALPPAKWPQQPSNSRA